MIHLSKTFITALMLLSVVLCLTSCSEENVQLENQKVQFTLSPSVAGESVSAIELPKDVRARITVAANSGAIVLSDHEIAVTNLDGIYTTEGVELLSGSYAVTEFVIIKDSVELYVAPKKGAELTSSNMNALPLNFSVDQTSASPVIVNVEDVRNEDVRKFGYTSAKAKGNSFAITVREKGSSTPVSSTAELRQDKKLLDVFSLAASTNTLTLGGNPKLPYTLTVYTNKSAASKTFTLKDLQKEIGKKPLQVELAPALVLSLRSSVDENNEYEEYFNFRMDGKGAVVVNWGDGEQTSANLPFEISHEYFSGSYRAIVTGDISKVTDFAGFSYSTIIHAITGLTNLHSLKVYDPSWGAVPIKVDLSNCKKLETIKVAKYGAPYEPCDLRTEFKLPAHHSISTFIFDAPSFDSNREFISAEELDVMVSNIYKNAINKSIYNGKFFVNPVVKPSSATQQKLDILTSQYNWRVGFNDDIYNAYDDVTSGRMKAISDSDSRREQWLRDRFSHSEQIIERGSVVASGN